MSEFPNKTMNNHDLLARFNRRDSVAFGDVYSLFHRELNLYATSLYRDVEIQSEDIVHDIFMNLWLSKITFEELQNIKAYVYISIKNGFKNYLAHNNHKLKYRNHVEVENDFFVDMVECEIYSFVEDTLKSLPETYSKVIELYIKGWKPGEIAAELHKTEHHIYNIKNEAINLLRKKITKDKLLFIISLIG